MRILEQRALRGPNYYSRYPVIHMTLDIDDMEDKPSDEIPGFTERLLTLIPSLREHRCSPGYPGGFVERLERGTWAAHIVEHVALELQSLAGMEVGYGKTRTTSKHGVYTVVYRYRDEDAGLQAGRDAVDVVRSMEAGKRVDLAPILDRLRDIRESNLLGPSTRSIVDEARRRGIPVLRLDESSYVQLGHGVHQRRIQATMTSRTAGIAVEIADDKERTKRILAEAGVPVPKGDQATTVEDALEIAERLGYPVAVKPLVGNHGRGITTNVRTPEDVRAAFDLAREVHRSVVVERHLAGADFRLLVVDHKLVAAARRDPAQVTGDGVLTVRQLIDLANADPRRGFGHEKVLTRIEVDENTVMCLERQDLTLDSVPADGAVVVLKSAANISSGGTATDVTDEVHPAVRAMAERISRIIGMDVMGIDVVAPDLRRPVTESGGGVVEVNAAPGFRMHLEPASGKPRNVAAAVLDMLFPPGTPAAIPIVAITGTNGKTTTGRLLSHILKYNGARVGMTSTTGVEVDNQVIMEGDYSGPSGAQAVLREPSVDHAVLEVARGGILRRGLAFDECDVAVFLNVGNDHLGEGEIETLDDLARLKGTIVDVVKETGTAVLNADDPRVLQFKDKTRGEVVLFSLDPMNRAVREHLEDGGRAVTVADGNIVLRHGSASFHIGSVREVPITLDGKALFNVQNTLAAVAAACALGVPHPVVCTAIATFNPTVAQLPGRMNLLDVGNFKVLIDYGHNVPALEALATVLPHLAHGRRINMASAPGNRRDQELRAFGATLARMYHHIVLTDPDPRGRERGETADIVRDGLRAAGFPDTNLQIVLDEEEAIDVTLAMAGDGDLVVLQVDDVKRAIRKVRELQEARERAAPEAAPATLPTAPVTGGGDR